MARNIVRTVVWFAGATASIAALAVAARSAPQVREISVRGEKFAFSPATIEVQKDEIVKVTFTAVDMPHTFTIDSYRISKRAAAGQTVTFEFRADRTGPFRFYCELKQDDRCREMHGELTVK